MTNTITIELLVRAVDPATPSGESTNPNDTAGFAQQQPTPPTRPIDQTWAIVPRLALVLTLPDPAPELRARKHGGDQQEY